MARCQGYLGLWRQSICIKYRKTNCCLGFDEKYYPDARISTYATISDFKNKTVDDIKRIKEHGLDEIMIGIETGDDEVLQFVNKGYTAQDILDAGRKMDEAGITYRMIYLGGLAGKGNLVKSAKNRLLFLIRFIPTI